MTVATEKKLSFDWPPFLYIVLLHLVAILAFFPQFFSWEAVGVALIMHWVTGGVGVTLGFHRLLSHRSFEVPKWLEYFFVFCGTLSAQGSVIDWVGLHRIHHKHSDHKADPHDSNQGFLWSHIGWMIHEIPAYKDIPKYTQDINADPVYRFLSKYFILIQVAFGFFLYAIGGWSFVIWGVFFRLVAVFHCTWLVNSATHKFGYQTYESNDHSRNCWWVALLTYGEGWHNNHHAYQYSARHGLKWWEIDPTWMMIRSLEIIGLAKNVKLIKE